MAAPGPDYPALVKIGAVAAFPAYLGVQAIKAAAAKRLEPVIGAARWNWILRSSSGALGLAAGFALGGWPWGAFAGAAGGLAATAVFAALLRMIRAWRPPGAPPAAL